MMGITILRSIFTEEDFRFFYSVCKLHTFAHFTRIARTGFTGLKSAVSTDTAFLFRKRFSKYKLKLLEVTFMPTDKDWYPSSFEGQVAFHVNLDDTANDFKAKYGWDDATLAWIHADRLWMVYWYNRQLAIKGKTTELTQYVEKISGNKKDVDPPQTPDFSPASAAPAEVPPGIEDRTRELRRETVNKSNYSDADGLALGFERVASDAIDFTQNVPEIDKLETMPAFDLRVFTAKKGVDAHRYEGRFKGGEWFHISDEAESPAVLHFTPPTPGEAAQVEIRCIGMVKYKIVGLYSAIQTALIAP
jgi:hypothetical protein